MILRNDALDRIALDRCVSASGAYESVFCFRFERGRTMYYIVNLVASTHRVRQIVQLGADIPLVARIMWEGWKERFSTKPDDAVYLDEVPSGLQPIRWSPPILIKEDLFVLKLKPKGGYMFVRDIPAVDEITLRGERANLKVIVAEENQPRPSMAIVINLGPDPLLHEEFRVGDIVMFRTHAGGTFMEAGYEYRYLQHHEIIGSRSPDDGLADLLPREITPEMRAWAESLMRTIDQIMGQPVSNPLTSRTSFDIAGFPKEPS